MSPSLIQVTNFEFFFTKCRYFDNSLNSTSVGTLVIQYIIILIYYHSSSADIINHRHVNNIKLTWLYRTFAVIEYLWVVGREKGGQR